MKNKKFWKIICILAVIAYTLKNLFIGADTDEGYGIMVGYRLAMGDCLLLDMWEPHQTSAIFTALFIAPFVWLTGGVNYLNLFLRFVFFPIQAGISVFLYKTIRKAAPQIDAPVAALMGVLYYVTTPKSIFIPEYSNLHNWFFALMVLCMVRYLTGEGRLRYLVLSGIFMTCDVLAYPSMVLVFLCCMGFLLLRKSAQKGREVLAYLLPCVLSAGAMFGYLLTYMSPQTMLQMVGEILGEGSHQTSVAEKLLDWGKSLGETLMILLAALLIAGLIRWIVEKKMNMTAYRYNNNMEIWQEAVPDGSTVLYVGPSQFYCMLGEHTQASPDTICSMIYDERLLDYWELHPERYPDVVVFESSYGDIRQEGDNFIWHWLMEDFQPTERKDYPYIAVFTR